MTRFFKLIVHSNLFISVCTPLLFLMYALKAHQNFSLLTPFFLFFGSFVTYNFLRIAPTYKSSAPSKSAELFLKYKYFYVLPLIASIVLTGLEVYRSERYWPLILSLFIVGLYEYKNWNLGLRKIPILKTFMVSIVWANLCTALFPQLDWVHYTECFIFIFLLTLIFDYKDKDQDEKDNILTIARLLPEKYFLPFISISYTLFCAYLAHQFQEYSFFGSVIIVYFVLYNDRIKNTSLHILIDGLILLRSLLYFCQH